MKTILLTGSLGQLGSEISVALQKQYGKNNVIVTDIRDNKNQSLINSSVFYKVDSRDGKELSEIINKHKIDTIYHLASLLSATAEKNPQKAWDINTNGLYTVLEIAREKELAVFTPSSIAAFGPTAMKDFTPQDTIQRPTSIYGITKVVGELLCDYYFHKYDVDTRGVRYPGIISNITPPGGGTTDYAVEIYYAAIKEKKYTCFLKENTYLDMMYIPDAVKASIDLMEADPYRLRHRNAFNITSMSFSPEEQAAYIRKYIPEFEIDYKIDPVKQALADSWPNNLEDYAARVEWDWKPVFDLDKMTEDMLKVLSDRKNRNSKGQL
jgi:nucleoside-diphosphate-sugar epimerase